MNLDLNKKYFAKYLHSSNFLKDTPFAEATTAITAGSGISNSFVPEDILSVLQYCEIPNFPKTTVEGHDGKLILLNINGSKVLLFSGRFHIYEGFEVDEVVSQVIVSHLLGIKNFIFTNAAGGLNETYLPGDLMFISDTVNFTYRDLGSIFDGFDFRQKISKYEKNLDIYKKLNSILTLKGINLKFGTYLGVMGPNYETRSEIRMFRRMGADAVGMSTVLELSVADILGMNTIACSLITNSAKEIPQMISHREVVDLALKSKLDVRELLFAATNLLNLKI